MGLFFSNFSNSNIFSQHIQYNIINNLNILVYNVALKCLTKVAQRGCIQARFRDKSGKKERLR